LADRMAPKAARPARRPANANDAAPIAATARARAGSTDRLPLWFCVELVGPPLGFKTMRELGEVVRRIPSCPTCNRIWGSPGFLACGQQRVRGLLDRRYQAPIVDSDR